MTQDFNGTEHTHDLFDEEGAPSNDPRRSGSDAGKRIKREDLHDIAKFGGDLLKKAVGAGFEVIKEVTEGLPKEASQFISNRKEDVLKGISKDVAAHMANVAMDKFFSIIRSHKLEVSVRLVKADEKPAASAERHAPERPAAQRTASPRRTAGKSRSSKSYGRD